MGNKMTSRIKVDRIHFGKTICLLLSEKNTFLYNDDKNKSKSYRILVTSRNKAYLKILLP